METLAYLYAIEDPADVAKVGTSADADTALFLSGSLEDDQFELLDDEVDELEQSVIWIML